jgi:trk system potassium uptake protein TrkH
LLNGFSERVEMDFKSSAMLITSAFLVLGLGGSIPYLYLDIFPGGIVNKFTNSFFESMSGFTTGGFTFIENVDSLPQSLLLYRSLTQWIGGIGIIFILLAFFYNKEVSLQGIARFMGLNRITQGLKLILSHILVVYIVYALVLVGALYYFGFDDLIKSTALVLSSLATGGLSPASDLQAYVYSPAFFIVIIAMVLGALNFFLHDKIMLGKVRGIFKIELVAYIAILVGGVTLFVWISDLPMRASVFHAFSASTTAGFSYIDFAALNEGARLLLIFLMFVGGMTFSTAGGIKVLSLIMFFKSIPWVLDKFMYDSKKPVMYEGEQIEEKNFLAYLIFPMVAVGVIFISTFIFVFYGHSISQSLFETVAAYSLTGFSNGIVNIGMPFELKWLVVFLMLVGRVEILTFLIFLKPRRKEGKLATGTIHVPMPTKQLRQVRRL